MTKVSTITPCYNMSKYMEGFLDNLSQQTHKDLEVVMDHNDPTEREVELVEAHNDIFDNIFHIKVEGVDPIGVSMNRCIENASGEYLWIWNVDDLRTPDSIEIMANVLDNNPDIGVVYGNYNMVTEFGSTEGRYIDVKPFIHELRIGMILGPFFMFRKSLIEKSGLFDEQLISGADYDLALRLVFNSEAHFMPDVLGYYLNEGLGQSTKPNSKQALERTLIELRYGVRVLDNSLIELAKDSYDLENIIIDEEKIPVSTYV